PCCSKLHDNSCCGL
uniref:Conotoxin tx5e n=1 Tax=Conus textile TaxID=6494 RepID=CX5E_CONTE|nr:RecName: Full=Conotoxin tx5e [Conus textile]